MLCKRSWKLKFCSYVRHIVCDKTEFFDVVLYCIKDEQSSLLTLTVVHLKILAQSNSPSLQMCQNRQFFSYYLTCSGYLKKLTQNILSINTPKSASKMQICHFMNKNGLLLKNSAAKFVCVKTSNDKVVRK